VRIIKRTFLYYKKERKLSEKKEKVNRRINLNFIQRKMNVFGNALFFFRKKENYAHFVRVFSNKFENRRKEKKK